MLLKIASIILTSCILLSCTVSDKSPKLLLKPEGERVKISLSEGDDVMGELLSVNEMTIFVDIQHQIFAVPISLVKNVLVEEYDLNVKKEMHEKIKYFSRYPQGLSESQWRNLLDHYQQKELIREFDSIQ